VEGSLEERVHKAYIGIHDKDNGRCALTYANIVALPITTILRVLYENDIGAPLLPKSIKHGLRCIALIINHYKFNVRQRNIGMLLDGRYAIIDIALRLIGYYDDGQTFHCSRGKPYLLSTIHYSLIHFRN
jgi:hypothetical protein